jgi:A/G-specific adenine glycosylase
VGPYTAAAIAAFAFEERTTVLDGNVFRVLARLFDLHFPIDVEKNKVHFIEILMDLLAGATSSEFNQAVMEFGALQCLPHNPDCESCVLNEHCLALKNKTINARPVKQRKVKVKKRFFTYVWIATTKAVLLKKRDKKDIWQGLYEPFLIESSKALKRVEEVLEHSPELKKMGKDLVYVTSFKHVLTHQQLFADFFVLKLENLENNLSLEVISLEKLAEIPFSRLTEKFLEFMEIEV